MFDAFAGAFLTQQLKAEILVGARPHQGSWAASQEHGAARQQSHVLARQSAQVQRRSGEGGHLGIPVGPQLGQCEHHIGELAVSRPETDVGEQTQPARLPRPWVAFLPAGEQQRRQQRSCLASVAFDRGDPTTDE
ncbi:hypothetical protein [Kutzneria sp. NPDC052558]|uniref:hypothetical protein n=1 Tax=Kutzneria sp. NPDC052558 TaxID=3364121 RepID=UPI0037C8664F